MDVKKIIRDKLLENLLKERITDINEDVDLIYDLGFKDDVNRIKETGVITKYMFPASEISTKYLKSEYSIKANKLNPCKILINSMGNFYKPSEQIISVGVHRGAKDLIIDNGGKLDDVNLYLNKQQSNGIKLEFSEEKLKGSIHHELVHWIDDTFNNKHITKLTSSPDKLNKLRKKNINTNYMEIQGQIHNIVQLKRKYNDIWDGIKFLELIEMSPTLSTIYYSLSGDSRSKWVKNIKTRMYREGLLGKTMTNH